MQQRFSPMRATLLLGLLWAAWHFFLYLLAWLTAGASEALMGAASFTALITTVSVVFTWLSNNTRASLLLAMLLHGTVNGTATYLQILAERGVIPPQAAAFALGVGTLSVTSLAALALTALTRGKLGYPRYRTEAEHLDLEPALPTPA